MPCATFVLCMKLDSSTRMKTETGIIFSFVILQQLADRLPSCVRLMKPQAVDSIKGADLQLSLSFVVSTYLVVIWVYIFLLLHSIHCDLRLAMRMRRRAIIIMAAAAPKEKEISKDERRHSRFAKTRLI